MKTIATLTIIVLFSISFHHKDDSSLNSNNLKPKGKSQQLYQFYFIANNKNNVRFSVIKDFKDITAAEADLANTIKNLPDYTKRVAGPFEGTNVARKDMDEAKQRWKDSGYTIGAL